MKKKMGTEYRLRKSELFHAKNMRERYPWKYSPPSKIVCEIIKETPGLSDKLIKQQEELFFSKKVEEKNNLIIIKPRSSAN